MDGLSRLSLFLFAHTQVKRKTHRTQLSSIHTSLSSGHIGTTDAKPLVEKCGASIPGDDRWTKFPIQPSTLGEPCRSFRRIIYHVIS